jgi:hypothetical protein
MGYARRRALGPQTMSLFAHRNLRGAWTIGRCGGGDGARRNGRWRLNGGCRAGAASVREVPRYLSWPGGPT